MREIVKCFPTYRALCNFAVQINVTKNKLEKNYTKNLNSEVLKILEKINCTDHGKLILYSDVSISRPNIDINSVWGPLITKALCWYNHGEKSRLIKGPYFKR